MTMPYRRILVKLSGEALQAPDGFWLDAQVLTRLSQDIARATAAGFEIALVIGGGNIIRGARNEALPAGSTARRRIPWGCSPR